MYIATSPQTTPHNQVDDSHSLNDRDDPTPPEYIMQPDKTKQTWQTLRSKYQR